MTGLGVKPKTLKDVVDPPGSLQVADVRKTRS
jgi:hypothetical protein